MDDGAPFCRLCRSCYCWDDSARLSQSEKIILPTLPSTLPAGAPPAFHLLSKPTGAICNLDCAYCFFLAKEMLYPGSRFRMAEELLETYLRQLIESHRTPEVTIAWQGGEPTLMGLPFFAVRWSSPNSSPARG